MKGASLGCFYEKEYDLSHGQPIQLQPYGFSDTLTPYIRVSFFIFFTHDYQLLIFPIMPIPPWSNAIPSNRP